MDYFSQQLKTTKIITEEVVDELKGKTLFNKKYAVGDQILMCIIEPYHSHENFKVVTLVESELHKFYKIWRFTGYKYNIPMFV